MKPMIVAVATLMISVASHSATSQMGGMRGNSMMEEGHMMGGAGMGDISRLRHRYFMRHGIDTTYADKSNPLDPNPPVLETGERLYTNNCASCHGESGLGDGLAADSLNPKPANITAFSRMPMASDAYLYWTIAEGGAPVNSAMPAFQQNLEEEEIWSLITYLRAGL
ncbi:c-type cytochrome [Halomonas sp. ZH2S]|uniref:C-type cytochrome n=1 Tax=Vreelandella zhuhanensis TaxID=2684210 RepID=A0A7X3KQ49_9GAMM|nr:cytochrome c [Halomonas zhuhanensis]MWJ28124.1 c-type cytochrome [Halomonas zhuhanensis]